MTDKVKHLKEDECRLIKIGPDAVNEITAHYFFRNKARLFKLKKNKANLFYFQNRTSGDLICAASNGSFEIDHDTKDFLTGKIKPTAASVCDFGKCGLISVFIKGDHNFALSETKKNSVLASNEIRIIRIEESAVDELLFEFF